MNPNLRQDNPGPSGTASWLVSGFRDEIPDAETLRELRAIAPSRTGHAVDHLVDLATSLGSQEGPGASREIFIEQAARIDAAIEAVGASSIWIDSHDGMMFHLGDRTVAPAESLLPRLGALPRNGRFRRGDTDGSFFSGTEFVVMESEARALGSLGSSVLSEHSGRGVSAVPGHLRYELADQIADAVRVSEDRTVWLTVRTGSPQLLRVHVPEGWEDGPGSLRDLKDTLSHGEDPTTANDVTFIFPSDENTILVAPHVSLRAEYRVFLVEGVPVTGPAASTRTRRWTARPSSPSRRWSKAGAVTAT